MVIRLERGLDIVANNTRHARRFCHRSVTHGFFLQMFQLSQGPSHPSFWVNCAGLLKDLIGTIQLAQVPCDGFVDLSQLLAQLATRVILALGIDRLEPAAIDSDDVTVQQVHITTQGHTLQDRYLCESQQSS